MDVENGNKQKQSSLFQTLRGKDYWSRWKGCRMWRSEYIIQGHKAVEPTIVIFAFTYTGDETFEIISPLALQYYFENEEHNVIPRKLQERKGISQNFLVCEKLNKKWTWQKA